MAAQPTVAELIAQIQALQGQVNALTAAAAAPAAPVAPTPVVFADTPQSLDVENVIDYGTKRGSEIFKQGCAALDDKSLTDGFNMTADQVVIFVEALQRRRKEMGWDKGSKNITLFLNRDGVAIDIIKNCGQVDEASLHRLCAFLLGRWGRLAITSKTEQHHDEHLFGQVIVRRSTSKTSDLPQGLHHRGSRALC
jgi:hypothetical protein